MLDSTPVGASLSPLSLSHLVSWDPVLNRLFALDSLSLSLLLGNTKLDMGERFQDLVSLDSVSFPFMASPNRKQGVA